MGDGLDRPLGEHGGEDGPQGVLLATAGAAHSRCKVYAEVRGKREGRPYRIGEDQAVLRNTYVAGSMEEAKRDAEEGILSIFQYNDPYRGTQVFLNPGEEVDPDTKLSWDFLEPRALLVGSPEHIIERLEEHQEICGLDEILVGYAHHRVPQKKTLKNLELFATKVMPHFQKGQEAAAE